MSAEQVQTYRQSEDDPYQAALDRALRDLADATGEADRAREAVTAAEQRVDDLTRLAGSLIEMLPEAGRAEYARRLASIRPSSPSQMRGSPVYDNVIRLFKEMPRRDWSVSDVREALERRTGPVDGKALHNVLYYLARRGDLRRVGRGVYRIVSLGLAVTSDDEGLDRMTQHGGETGN